jgi:hypothetical protein
VTGVFPAVQHGEYGWIQPLKVSGRKMNDFVAFLMVVGCITLFFFGCRWCDKQGEKKRDEFIRLEIERDSMEGYDE